MSIYTDAMEEMDEIVDDTLGDRAWYAPAGSSGFTEIVGFFINEEPQGYEPNIDDMSIHKQFKVAQAIVPEIKRGDRIKDSQFSSIEYQPIVSTVAQEGRYWLFNIQVAQK